MSYLIQSANLKNCEISMKIWFLNFSPFILLCFFFCSQLMRSSASPLCLLLLCQLYRIVSFTFRLRWTYSLTEKKGEAVLFADDTSIMSSHKSNSQINLQYSVNEVSSWLTQNKLTSNLDKTNVCNFNGKTFSCHFGSRKLKQIKLSKYLGLKIDAKLKFKDHIDYVCKKSIKYFANFYRIRKIFHRLHLLEFYNALLKRKFKFLQNK